MPEDKKRLAAQRLVVTIPGQWAWDSCSSNESLSDLLAEAFRRERERRRHAGLLAEHPPAKPEGSSR